ncbi:polysaccharide pyruvyl transferase CsaB [Limnoraphis robusta Tam1]|uniref:Polysaccharide pyruvyl transferase CsaB n=1 Tax=Limnoraphis robusta CCNP1315 TaxID=3110306 RepID=A0ABU5TW88_9CYAN|nr:polysaccharide pyruvyl transferase CsaB [Limnoraphis robusta]MEA5498969.1 polysaccharide pyruvyl transferase CsaB [Limnoraphis robusta BA-68 BA1]MEA5518982.1 polysaccharide pyruvyl transferase CsaB [Limnoraphis robusta CCNP1315]MEA5539429.1 polysaccharide pyruvyl transferase CsaB [Limnoraphis robusta Tam1]MEA5544046.1 polysaccharide pyruvyl transferase CsaB [Limnoraphis robusta CCNP1324]
MERVVCSGYYGKGNGGDEALLASLLQMLPPSVEPIVLSGNPTQTQDRYQVASYDRMNALEVFNVLRRADAFIWGGGSLIQDVSSAISPFYYAGLMGLAQQIGLKTIAWAQGIGPLNRGMTRRLAQRSFSNCTTISVRDRASAQLLSDWQIPFILAPDPVWALDSKPVPGLWDLPAPRVALTLRPHPQLTPERLSVLTQALVSFQKATQAFILLLPFQLSQDLAIAQLLHRAIPDQSQILTLEDPRQLKGVFRGVEMVIGMRFHSLIMAATEECRCFALSYDPKVTQLMTELDFPGWELSQLPTDANVISKSWLECYANGDALSTAKIEFLVERSQIHQEVLHSVFL